LAGAAVGAPTAGLATATVGALTGAAVGAGAGGGVGGIQAAVIKTIRLNATRKV
jgi:hypothetical protein